MATRAPVRIGRYVLHHEIGSGGTASVYLGRVRGTAGFSRIVALKRLHPHLAKESEFGALLLDEARISCRINHPNVVQTLDVVALEGEILLVLEYVHGASLAQLVQRARARDGSVPPAIACAIIVGALHGLHAAHEATSETGAPLEIVHRDVSPQNILVGADGSARVLDFGIARAAGRITRTEDGRIRGKVAYMSPEQLRGHRVDRRTDVYATAVVLWEALAGRRLYDDADAQSIYGKVMRAEVTPLDQVRRVCPELAAVVMKGLAADPDDRFATTREMALAIESAHPLASASSVGDWVSSLVADGLRERARCIAAVELGGREGDLEHEAIARTDHGASEAQTRTAAPVVGKPAAPVKRSRLRSVGPIVVVGLVTFCSFLAYRAGRASSVHADAAISAAPPALPPAEPSSSPPSFASAAAPALAPISSVSVRSEAHHETPPSRRPRIHAPAAPVPTAKAECDPPFTFDDQGKRRFKRECLR
jgi:eukaryotic-like serine/threonine-protein kinase